MQAQKRPNIELLQNQLAIPPIDFSFLPKMACNSGTCQSGCYRDSSNEAEEHPPVKIANEAPNDVANGRKSTEQLSIAVCVKCKVNKTIAAAASADGGGDFIGGDRGRFCADCFRSNLYGKFRFAVTSNAMISPSDNVLVAFSGGTCSRFILCLHFQSVNCLVVFLIPKVIFFSRLYLGFRV